MVHHEKRRAPRVAVENGPKGRLKATVPVTIIDVSRFGLQMEISTSLRPGSMYELKTDIGPCTVVAHVRITRCRAGGYLEDGRGGRLLVFRAGAEFVHPEDEALKSLRKWIEDSAVGPPGRPATLGPGP